MGKQNQDGTGSTGDQDKDTGVTISNADVKAHPLFQKVKGELSDELAASKKENKSMRERLDALEAAENERQTKKLETEKNYEAATKKRIEKSVSDAKKAWDAEQAVKDKMSDAKLELTRAGFNNKSFVKMQLAEFDHENQSVEDFVKAVSDDPESAPFLDTEKGQPKKKSDPHPTPSKGKGLMTPAEIQAARASGDQGAIDQANDAAAALWVANGGSTGLPT